MHVLQLPFRHWLRITGMAALLTLGLTVLVLVAGAELGATDTATAPVASPRVQVPLAPPNVFEQPLTAPLTRLGVE